jgi:ankyrin repeat protein
VINRSHRELFYQHSSNDDQVGYTALHKAANWGCANAVALLLSKGANVNIKDNVRH